MLQTPNAGLKVALDQFQSNLTNDQRAQLQSISSIPDANAVITFTTQLDEENAKRKSRCVASRVSTFLQSIQQFASIVDTFVSSNPQIAALVWGSVKFALLLTSNFSSYFDKISSFLMGIGKDCPRYTEYQALYKDSDGLQKSLCNFYASLIRFCTEAVRALQNQGPLHFTQAILQPFDVRFGQFRDDIQICRKDIKEEIRLALHKATSQEQQLQLLERKEAASYRSLSKTFYKKADIASEEQRKWRVQRDLRRSSLRRQHLLDQLSVHNHNAAFNQARSKCYGTTGRWLTETTEFKQWVKMDESSFFWCSGSLGSGKTILTAKVIERLCQSSSDSTRITYFFCRFDDSQSLQSAYISRSLIRQCLDLENFPTAVETRLSDIIKTGSWDAHDLDFLLQSLIDNSRLHFIIIDGLDECAKAERGQVLKMLQSSIRHSSSLVKVFVASRDSIETEINRHFKHVHHVKTNPAFSSQDIETYLNGVLEQKIEDQDLIIGDPGLREEIRASLSHGAQGMFLWLFFQIEEICNQDTDEEIRQALRSLPKDLPDTYNRALSHIVRRNQIESVSKIFRLVGAAERPLTLEELREALAIEPGQLYLKRERMVNDISRVISHCENLVLVNEEDSTVHFAHHTIKTFLLDQPREPPLRKFHFEQETANFQLGEICVTYLSFNDFKRQLIKLPKPQVQLTADKILESTMNTIFRGRLSIPIPKLAKVGRARDHSFDVGKQLSERAGLTTTDVPDKGYLGYPFLSYASVHWLSHCSEFTLESPLWRLWTSLVETDYDLAIRPWTFEDWSARGKDIGSWIGEKDHVALLRLIEHSKAHFSDENVGFPW
ncbi:hypothetical protein K432DRAFT_430842 [Lepidopterella palustris CBS 459.81]|uniref:NACHT domain-containing protein n=1 Tax=Lepidopterella palustris CBS 459.81 TaxID=1314670 RepID=A0A8E2DW81_9PEZI|nr:hypothetical protein K432DRAFT_430842 [Lepidopterella palustris CBS 459.81]